MVAEDKAVLEAAVSNAEAVVAEDRISDQMVLVAVAVALSVEADRWPGVQMDLVLIPR